MKPHFAFALVVVLITPSVSAEPLITNNLNYAIDPLSDLNSDGAAAISSNTAGESLELTEPNGKGEVRGTASYGALAASTAMLLDFPVEDPQLHTANAEVRFSDSLTITGSNTGAPATATFRLRTRGYLQQPFFFSEATIGVQALVSLQASSPGGAQVDERSYAPEPPEPNPDLLVDDTLEVTLSFNVGDPIDLNAGLVLSIETNITNIGPPTVQTIQADFDGVDQGLQLESIALEGVDGASITAVSGATYAFTSTSSPVSVPLLGPMAVGLVVMGLCGVAWRRLKQPA